MKTKLIILITIFLVTAILCGLYIYKPKNYGGVFIKEIMYGYIYQAC